MVLIVPVNMEIGGNLVENWCQIDEKRAGKYRLLVSLFLIRNGN